MKISKETLAILKNFQAINKSLLFTEGKELRTISEAGTLFAIAQIEEEIPARAGIYELGKLISALSMYDDPDLTFGDRFFEIKNSTGKQKMRLVYTDPSLIYAPPEGRTLKMPDIDVKFELSQEDFSNIMKAGSNLGLTDFMVKGDGEMLYVGVANATDRNADSFFIEMGEYDKEIQYVVDITSLKFLNSNYIIKIGSKRVVFDNGKVQYFVALDSKKSKL